MKGYIVAASWCALLITILGTALAFWIPPFQVPDENRHWAAAFSQSQRLLTLYEKPEEKVCGPAAALPDFFQYAQIAYNKEATMQPGLYGRLESIKQACFERGVSYGNVLSYPGMIPARVLVAGEMKKPESAVRLFFLTRVLQGLMFFGLLIRLLYLSWRHESVPGSLTAFALCLSPLFLQQTFSLSADAVCNMLAVSLVTWLFFWSRTTWIDLLLLSIVALGATAAKPPLVVLLIFSLIAGKLATSPAGAGIGRREVSTLALSLLCIVSAVLTALSAGNTTQSPIAGEDIHSVRQLKHIAENPLIVSGVLFSEAYRFLDLNLLFHPLGWLDTVLGANSKRLWLTLLGLALLCDMATGVCSGKSSQFGLPKSRILLSGALVWLGSIATVLFMALAMYVAWTPVGSGFVQGLQTRYFFPPLILSSFAAYRVLKALLPSVSLPGGAPFVERLTHGLAISGCLLVTLLFGSYSVSLFVDIAERYW